MPTKTKRDEEKWQKAKEIAKEQGQNENYAYIMGIFKKMRPDYEFKTGPLAKTASPIRVAYQYLLKFASQETNPGGRAEEKGVTEKDFPKETIEKGIKVELEHTDDRNQAKKIVLDHLAESPDYYEALEKMEKELEVKKRIPPPTLESQKEEIHYTK